MSDMDTPANSLPTNMGDSNTPDNRWYRPGKKVRFIHRSKLCTAKVIGEGADGLLHIQWHDVVVFRQPGSCIRPK